MKIAIIGAGIVGASAAYHLSRAGIETIMIDSKKEGRATSAGAGIVCPWISSSRDPNWYKIAEQGAKFYQPLIANLAADEEFDIGYKQVGALSVSSDEAELTKIEQELIVKRRTEPEVGEVSRLTAEQAQAMFPPLNEDLAAVYITGAARVDGRLLRDALVRAAKKGGARFIEAEATLMVTDGQVSGVRINEEVINVDAILIAAGAWTNELLLPLGMQIKVEAQRGQIAHIKLPGYQTAEWPVVLPQSSHYMLAFDDSRVVAGATRETGSGFDYRVTAGGIYEVLSEALKVAPGLSDGELREMRIGFRPMGPDNLPILGKLASYDNIVLATGLGPSGLTMGPYVGSLAASLVGGDPVDIDLTPYNPTRAVVHKN